MNHPRNACFVSGKRRPVGDRGAAWAPLMVEGKQCLNIVDVDKFLVVASDGEWRVMIFGHGE